MATAILKHGDTEYEMKVARTGTLNIACATLSILQRDHLSRIWVDPASTGKSVTARYYAETFKEVAYLDCSQCKTWSRFIKAMAEAWGLNSHGRLEDVYSATIQHIKNLKNPMVLLDEAGDLNYNAFLEIKAYWNALNMPSYHCALVMIGAQGLRKKIERMRDRDKVGYEEIQHRFGKTFMQLWPTDRTEYMVMFNGHAKTIAEKNAPDIPLEILLDSNRFDKQQGIKSIDTLRRLCDNIILEQQKAKKK